MNTKLLKLASIWKKIQNVNMVGCSLIVLAITWKTICHFCSKQISMGFLSFFFGEFRIFCNSMFHISIPVLGLVHSPEILVIFVGWVITLNLITLSQLLVAQKLVLWDNESCFKQNGTNHNSHSWQHAIHFCRKSFMAIKKACAFCFTKHSTKQCSKLFQQKNCMAFACNCMEK